MVKARSRSTVLRVQFADLHRFIALHNLAVVQVHLQFEVGRANQVNDFMHGILTI